MRQERGGDDRTALQIRARSVNCAECGAEIEGGTEACHELMADLTVRSPDPRRLVVRRNVVDAYALQHPQTRCLTNKDVAGHLLSLCCALEYNNSLDIYSGMASWLRRARDLPELTPPDFRGALTIVDADAATSIEEYIEKVRKWSLSVWEAWHPYHETVREWIEEIRSR
jgi:hypothetical protein